MNSELVRRVIDNIAKKNIDTMPRNNKTDIKDSYEYQKKISLSNYSSGKDSNYNWNNKAEKKAIKLSSLANEIRGTVKNEEAAITSSGKGIKTRRDNTITLNQLSKLSVGKAEEPKTYKSLESSSTRNNKKNTGLSLEDLANNIKKNI